MTFVIIFDHQLICQGGCQCLRVLYTNDFIKNRKTTDESVRDELQIYLNHLYYVY